MKHHTSSTCSPRTQLAGVTSLWILAPVSGAALYQLKDHLPSMQSLRLRRISCRNEDQYPDNGETPRDIFTNTPSLKHVGLSRWTWDWKFDWSNSTHLELSFEIYDYQKPLLLSLQQAINLNTLDTTTVNNSFIISERITLPRLESMRVWDYHWLSYIKAPRLQNLCLHGSPAIDINIVILFLRESGCELTRLTLVDGSLPTKILRHVPGLIQLNLVDELHGNVVDYIESLCVPILPYPLVGSELAVPRLQSLQFDTWCRSHLENRTIDGLSKLLSLRNGQAANNGGRPAERLELPIVGKNVIRRDEKLIRLCGTFRVKLRSPEDVPRLFAY